MVQTGDELIRNISFLFFDIIGSQILAVEARGKKIADVEKSELVCADTHELVVSLDDESKGGCGGKVLCFVCPPLAFPRPLLSW